MCEPTLAERLERHAAPFQDVADKFPMLGYETLAADLRAAAVEMRRLERLDAAENHLHLIEFRDDGWTIAHPISERVDGSLFDCDMRWTTDDPGVRGRFVLEGDARIGVRIADAAGGTDET